MYSEFKKLKRIVGGRAFKKAAWGAQDVLSGDYNLHSASLKYSVSEDLIEKCVKIYESDGYEEWSDSSV